MSQFTILWQRRTTRSREASRLSVGRRSWRIQRGRWVKATV